MARGDHVVPGQHAQAPEGEAGRHGHGLLALLAGEVDDSVAARRRELAARHLEEAEVRRALEAVAHDDELDLGEDEAVPAAVLAHDVVQVGQAPEVLDLLDVALNAHARVEAVEALDEAHDAGAGLAAEDGGRRGGIAGDRGHEHLLVVAGGMGPGLGGYGELEGPVGAQGQGSVELGQEPVGVDGVQVALRFWVALRTHGGGEEGLRHGAVEEARGRAAAEGHDGRGVEGAPRAYLPDVPPKVLDLRVPEREGNGAHQAGGGIGGSEVVDKGGCGCGSEGGGLEGLLNWLNGLRLGCETGSDQGR